MPVVEAAVEVEAVVEEEQAAEARAVAALVEEALVEEAQGAARVAVAVKAVEVSADRPVHSQADWLRATRCRHRRNPPPGSA